MNGPEHYCRAQDLMQLSIRQREGESPDDSSPLSMLTMQQAQVHATLALAAAQAGAILGLHGVPSAEWQEATQ